MPQRCHRYATDMGCAGGKGGGARGEIRGVSRETHATNKYIYIYFCSSRALMKFTAIIRLAIPIFAPAFSGALFYAFSKSENRVPMNSVGCR